MKQFAEYRVDILLVANMLHGEIIKGRLQVFILAPQGLVRPAGNFDIAVITHHRQNFLRQQFVAQWGVIGPVVAIRRLGGVDVPLRRVITRLHHLIHQLEGAGNDGAAGFLRIEEFVFIHLFRLGMVADIDHIDVFIGPAEEQIQQDIKALGHVFGGLVHRA